MKNRNLKNLVPKIESEIETDNFASRNKEQIIKLQQRK